MISQLELFRALYGAWRLARLDRSGIGYFERTPAGARHSFVAALLVLPLFFLYQLDLFVELVQYRGFATSVVLEGLFYTIHWTAFLVLMATILSLFGLPEKYVPFVVVYNWSNVIQALIYLPAFLLQFFTPAPDALIEALKFAALTLSLAYSWFVISTATGLSRSVVVGLVVLDLVLSILIAAVSVKFILA